VLSTSLPFSNRTEVAGVEARDMLLQLGHKVKRALTGAGPT
jgi:hypothetical protein